MAFQRDTGLASTFASGDVVAKIARTIGGNSGWLEIGNAREIIAQLDAGAGTGTTPTLDVKFQTSFDGTDATAIDVPTGAFTQATTLASAQIKSLTQVHRYIKVLWAIGGTTPSYTFGVYITVRT